MPNKIALVTGAGTGKAVALALLREGYNVVFAGRRLDPLERAIAEAAAPQDRTLAVPADVGDPASVEGLFARTKAAFGRLDLLFNNAGQGAPPIPMEELTYEQWQAVVNANLTGAFLCTQQAIKIMKAQTPQGGRIINNGSISATVPRPFSAPYTATKHAITGLTKRKSPDFRVPRGDASCIGSLATSATKSRSSPCRVTRCNSPSSTHGIKAS